MFEFFSVRSMQLQSRHGACGYIILRDDIGTIEASFAYEALRQFDLPHQFTFSWILALKGTIRASEVYGDKGSFCRKSRYSSGGHLASFYQRLNG